MAQTRMYVQEMKTDKHVEIASDGACDDEKRKHDVAGMIDDEPTVKFEDRSYCQWPKP